MVIEVGVSLHPVERRPLLLTELGAVKLVRLRLGELHAVCLVLCVLQALCCTQMAAIDRLRFRFLVSINMCAL